jgi:hypothetical protein
MFCAEYLRVIFLFFSVSLLELQSTQITDVSGSDSDDIPVPPQDCAADALRS